MAFAKDETYCLSASTTGKHPDYTYVILATYSCTSCMKIEKYLPGNSAGTYYLG